MTALAKDRNTRRKATFRTFRMPVAASATIYAGAQVCANLTGYAVPAADTLGYANRGVAQCAADNSAGSDGDLYVVVQTGVIELENSATNAVTQADQGRIVYVEDDQTVATEAGGGKVIAGTMDSIDDETSKIWVMVPQDASKAGALTSSIETVSASGAISLYTRTTLLSIAATKAYTLAAGLYEGQRKTLVCSVASATPRGTITPATYATGTSETMTAVGDFIELEYHDADGWTRLQFGNLAGASDIETVSAAGAISVLIRTTLLSVAGSKAYTLADGLFEGQRKTLICSVSDATAAGVVTPATYLTATDETFNAVGDFLELEWHAGGWVRLQGGKYSDASNTETVTTGAISVLTNLSLVTCDGTKAYTLADGVFPGQRKLIYVTAATNTPIGTVTPVTLLVGTTFHIGAADEFYELEWQATGWIVLASRRSEGAAETKASGAMSVFTPLTIMTTSGAQAYTLADGLFVGQRKTIRCGATDNTGTLTPASVTGYATLAFDAVQEFADLRWDGAGWELMASLCTIA